MNVINGHISAPKGDYIEIVNKDLRIGRLQSILFDFDGTISVIREGWRT